VKDAIGLWPDSLSAQQFPSFAFLLVRLALASFFWWIAWKTTWRKAIGK
jgi:hypothetical protein